MGIEDYEIMEDVSESAFMILAEGGYGGARSLC